VSKNIILVRCRSSTVTLSCLPGYNISATVMAIDVKVCTMVELRPGTVFCLLVAISLGVSKCGVRKGARMDRLTPQIPIFAMTANISKTVIVEALLVMNLAATAMTTGPLSGLRLSLEQKFQAYRLSA